MSGKDLKIRMQKARLTTAEMVRRSGYSRSYLMLLAKSNHVPEVAAEKFETVFRQAAAESLEAAQEAR